MFELQLHHITKIINREIQWLRLPMIDGTTKSPPTLLLSYRLFLVILLINLLLLVKIIYLPFLLKKERNEGLLQLLSKLLNQFQSPKLSRHIFLKLKFDLEGSSLFKSVTWSKHQVKGTFGGPWLSFTNFFPSLK